MNKIPVFVLMMFCCAGAFAGEEKHAVLISAATASVEKFTNKELRLLYLGYPVMRGELRFEPLVNRSDNYIYQSFLQKVMFMSEQSYDRKLVTRVFRHGGERPSSYLQHDPLIAELKKNTNTITFVTSEVAARIEGVQVVQRLW